MQKSTIVFTLIVAYLVLINFVTSAILYSPNFGDSSGENIINGGVTNVGISDKVDILVEKHRWYGKIIQTNDLTRLSLFNLIPIPLRTYRLNWLYFHGVFIVLLILYFKLNKQEDKWQSYGLRH